MEPFVITQFIHTTRPEYSDYSWLMWPYLLPESTEWVPLEHERIPAGQLAVRRGARVEATDGFVGRVDELLVDAVSKEITHLVMREGHLWGQRLVTIPIAYIDHVEDDTVYLGLGKPAIERLPVVPVKAREEIEGLIESLRAEGGTSASLGPRGAIQEVGDAPQP